MARQSTGKVIVTKGKRDTTYAIRFTAYGKRRFQTVGKRSEGMTEAQAERELAHTLADVARGIWQEPAPEPEHVEMPTFHEYASAWQHRRELRKEVREATLTRNRYDLTGHLLPFFKDYRLDKIRKRDVERYIDQKVEQRESAHEKHTLSNRSINKTLTLLAQILDDAIDKDVLPGDWGNPAKGKSRRQKVERISRPYLDAPEQFTALLEAAGQVDAESRNKDGRARAIIATFLFGGLRIHELCNLRVSDLDLANGRLTVRKSKTEAGERIVPMLPPLTDELTTYMQRRACELEADDYLFRTRTRSDSTAKNPGRPSENNIRNRVHGPAIEKANEALTKRGLPTINPKVTPHGLRRSYASLLVSADLPITDVQYRMGHADPAETLKDYARVMRETPQARAALKRLVYGGEMAVIGRSSEIAPLHEMPEAA